MPPSGKTHEGPPAVMAGDPSSSACVRRRPTLPPRLQGSTIGAERLSFRVRNGTGRFPFAMAAGTLWRCGPAPDRISGTAQWTQQMCWSSPRPISTGQLHLFPGFHIRPINPVVWLGALPGQPCGRPHLEASFPLRCFQRLSLPNVANQPCSWRNNWHTRGSSVPVLSY